MKRTIKALCLKDGKQIFNPTDEECKKLWDQVERIDIEERYTIEEWNERFVLIRSFDTNWYCPACKVYHTQEHVCTRI